MDNTPSSTKVFEKSHTGGKGAITGAHLGVEVPLKAESSTTRTSGQSESRREENPGILTL